LTDKYSISGVVPFVVAMTARSFGADAGAILRGSGIELEKPPPADEQLEAVRYFEVWRRAIERFDLAFPLRVAAMFKLEDSEIFGFLAMSCETLGQAYDRTATYRALYCVGARWEIQLDPDATRLIWYPWPGDLDQVGYRAAMDFAVADMANAIRRLGRSGPRPTAVRLVHEAPSTTAGFSEHYGVAPTFGCALYELVYPPGLQDLPIGSFNSRLRDYFDDQCRTLVGAGSGASVVDQVRKHLINAMDGSDASIGTVAKRLGMSSRSLQRRLADERARYNDLLADVRAEFAKRYLTRGTVSASEIAYLIGFTEPPAFFKAFKRWTGMTPREFQLDAVA
jgi:AraC-like DNA-binding protein